MNSTVKRGNKVDLRQSCFGQMHAQHVGTCTRESYTVFHGAKVFLWSLKLPSHKNIPGSYIWLLRSVYINVSERQKLASISSIQVFKMARCRRANFVPR